MLCCPLKRLSMVKKRYSAIKNKIKRNQKEGLRVLGAIGLTPFC
jgi:hypothetical protein